MKDQTACFGTLVIDFQVSRAKVNTEFKTFSAFVEQIRH